ncbi:MAG: cob(I)yrinic acid a,c-diamide adenosyltransferase [Reichenbachiella sp.]
MKIYTKKGDKGKTGLIGGARVLKSDLRIEAYGSVDELNSYVGLLRDQEVALSKKEELIEIQNELFVIGSHLAMGRDDSKFKLPDLSVTASQKMEEYIDKMEACLPEMKFFVLPGGHTSVSHAHIARTVCRRTERQVVQLSQIESVADVVLIYLNRLSDYLFVLSRWFSQELEIEEIPWTPKKD